jgi:hypothetical protein
VLLDVQEGLQAENATLLSRVRELEGMVAAAEAAGVLHASLKRELTQAWVRAAAEGVTAQASAEAEQRLEDDTRLSADAAHSTRASAAAAFSLLHAKARPRLNAIAIGLGSLLNAELAPLFRGAAEQLGGAAAGVPTELKVAFVAEICNEVHAALRKALRPAALNDEQLSAAIGAEALGELCFSTRAACTTPIMPTSPASCNVVNPTSAVEGVCTSLATSRISLTRSLTTCTCSQATSPSQPSLAPYVALP